MTETNRTALVTGASSGIGEAFAERLAGDGFDLVLVARRRERLESLAARLTDEHGVSARVIVADLADATRLHEVCAEVGELPVGMLVNNAALAHYMPVVELSSDLAQELVHLNVLAPTLLTHAVLPGMLERAAGAVINVASLLAFSGAWESPHLPQRAVYAGSKSYLVTFTQRLASELVDSGVRAQVVCPGVVRSEFHSRQGLDMSGVPRMEPASVVQASLHDLESGTVVCVPGADDAAILEHVEAAEHDLLGVTRAVELPDRFR